MAVLYFYMSAAPTLIPRLGITSGSVKWFFKFHASGLDQSQMKCAIHPAIVARELYPCCFWRIFIHLFLL
jgi:hypothetical protein